MKKSQAFSLLEVIIAAAILAVCGISLSRGLRGVSTATARAEAAENSYRLLSGVYAATVIDAQRLSSPGAGETGTRCFEGYCVSVENRTAPEGSVFRGISWGEVRINITDGAEVVGVVDA